MAVCVCVNEEITQIAFCFVSRCMLVSTLLHRLQGNKYVFAILKICFKENIPTGLLKCHIAKVTTAQTLIAVLVTTMDSAPSTGRAGKGGAVLLTCSS